jgi:hypothetical protein
VARGPFPSAFAWTPPPLNVTLSAFFLAFACAAALSTRQMALGLMAVELVGFLAYLFLLRGGYAVGISGTPSLHVVQFDILSVAGRHQKSLAPVGGRCPGGWTASPRRPDRFQGLLQPGSGQMPVTRKSMAAMISER